MEYACEYSALWREGGSPLACKNPNNDERACTLRHKMFIFVGLNPEYETFREADSTQ